MSLWQNYRRPVNIIALINLMAFALLFLYLKPEDNLLIIAGAVMICSVYLTNVLMIYSKFDDEILFLIISMLSTIGIIILFRLEPQLGFKQVVWFVWGNILFFFAAFIFRKINFWDRLVYIYPLISFLLFCLTLIFGTTVKGATNWIMVGQFTFQPSEIIKLLFIFFIASYYRHPEKLAVNNLSLFKRIVNVESKYVFMALSYIHIAFLVLQRELGTALLLFLIYLVLVFVFDSSMKYLFLNVVVGTAGGLAGLTFVHHAQVRVEAWLNPWADVAGKGYQITQSLFAIGAGGFFGTGIGLGNPQFIPEVATDFIFSAICEELGIFGGMAVVLLFFILVYRGIKISLKAKDIFYKAAALGIAVMFGFQAFIIVGGVIRLIPLTGITLPFISYGGSSLTASFLALGVLQAVSFKYGEEENAVAEAEQKDY